MWKCTLRSNSEHFRSGNECFPPLLTLPGILVHSNYERYFFERLSEAKEHLDKMRNQRIRMYQKRRRYRGRKCHYQIDKQLACGSIILCSKELFEGRDVDRKMGGSELFQSFQSLVGLKLIDSTLQAHQLPNIPQKTPNSS